MHPTVTERGTSVSPTLPTLPFRWAPCKVALAFESSVDLAAVDLLEAVVLYSGVDNLSNNGTTLHCMPRRRHSNGNQAGAQICYSADVCCVLLSKTLYHFQGPSHLLSRGFGFMWFKLTGSKAKIYLPPFISMHCIKRLYMAMNYQGTTR
jgi:hypothetical protein